MSSSLLAPPEEPPSDVCISKMFIARSFAALLKYWISAFEWRPKTPGAVNSGIVSMNSRVDSKVSSSGTT